MPTYFYNLLTWIVCLKIGIDRHLFDQFEHTEAGYVSKVNIRVAPLPERGALVDKWLMQLRL